MVSSHHVHMLIHDSDSEHCSRTTSGNMCSTTIHFVSLRRYHTASINGYVLTDAVAFRTISKTLLKHVHKQIVFLLLLLIYLYIYLFEVVYVLGNIVTRGDSKVLCQQ